MITMIKSLIFLFNLRINISIAETASSSRTAFCHHGPFGKSIPSPSNFGVVTVSLFDSQLQQQQQQRWNLYSSSFSNNNNNNNDEFNSDKQQLQQEYKEYQTKEANKALSKAAMYLDSTSTLLELQLVGQGNLPQDEENNDDTPYIFLSDSQQSGKEIITLPIPFTNGGTITTTPKAKLTLLSHTFRSIPLSKTLCLRLNSLLVNRDDALFDNMPWFTWTIDPYKQNYDAAQNVIEEKYHLGKRDGYNRMMGKDWPGQSYSIGNFVKRVEYLLDGVGGFDDGDVTNDDDNVLVEGVGLDENAMQSLATRMLTLEIKEAKMNLAEKESTWAKIRTEIYGSAEEEKEEEYSDWDAMPPELERALEDVNNARFYLAETEQALRDLTFSNSPKSNNSGGGTNQDTTTQSSSSANSSSSSSSSYLSTFLAALSQTIQSNPYISGADPLPPYRGALGYGPQIDTPTEMFSSSKPYTSPYNLLKIILQEQCNADVIGVALENTSLFPNQVSLGGVVILRRKGVSKNVKIDGENVSIEDNDDDYGNEGLSGGDVYVVECDVDEAIGMALECNVNVWMEKEGLWDEIVKRRVEILDREKEESNILDVIPMVKILDEIERPFQKEEEESSDDDEEKNSSKQQNESVYSTENPITSMVQYDSLSTADKAELLLSLESFKDEKLPRPRALREAAMKQKISSSSKNKKNSSPNNNGIPSIMENPLDKLLLPLIDESIRRQILIRDAQNRGDTETATLLSKSKSKRQIALENVAASQKASQNGGGWNDNNDDQVVDLQSLQEEADLYGELRADVTQDEGSYSRFLDRDEWYERDRQRNAKRVDRSKFGNLLDGIE